MKTKDSPRAINSSVQEVRNLLEYRNLQIPIVTWILDSFECEELIINFDMPTVGVSALSGYAIAEEMAQKFSRGILHLHPSLLPTVRDADPIPWKITDKQVQGISIHLIDQELDTGDLGFQREITSTIDMSAGEIYDFAAPELFSEFWMFSLKSLTQIFTRFAAISKHDS